MLFTLGNFITLGIVAVVLVIYRGLDKDNRSLEKVKKYADRQRDELSAYVEKRSDDLQRYAIELDVQQKAAKEVLKRIQGVEEGLSARAEAIGAIETRLAEYDTALARLMQMSSAVDENLARLHEENEFTNALSRKLDNAQKSLKYIEEELPALKDGFNRDNVAALASFREELLSDVESKLEDTKATLLKASSEAQELLATAQNGKREASREFELAFQRARVEAEKLEDLAFDKLREGSEAKAARLKETVEEKFREIGQAAKDKATETQGLIKGLKAEWKAESDSLLDATRATVGAAAEDLGKRLDSAEARLLAVESNYEEAAARIEKKTEATAAGLQEKAKVILASHKEELERKASESKARIEAVALELAALAKSAEENAAAAEKTQSMAASSLARQAELLVAADADLQARFTAELAHRTETLDAEFKVRQEKLELRLSTSGTELEARVAESFERKLAEYSSDMEGKFARLEAINVDIGTMEAALREAMTQAERRVENDFAAFKAAIEERNTRFEETIGGQSSELREAMKTLETELDALKSRAYENVSEKLKLFEDDFFADLKTRSETIDARLETWKAEIDKTLSELSAKSQDERLAAEKASLEEVRAHMADTQNRILEQLEKLRERVQGIADGITAQGGMAQVALAELKESVMQDSADASKTAQAYVEAELARLNLETDSHVKATEKSINERLDAMAAAIDAEAGRLGSLRDATSMAASAFKNEFQKSLAETERGIHAEFEAFKTATLALSESFRKEYEGQRDGYMRQAQSERDRITQDLSSLGDRAADLRQDLSSRIAQALDGFSHSFEAFSSEVAKRQKEAEADAKAQLLAFKDAAQDIFVKVEANRVQAFAKVEAEAGRISQSMAEIEKAEKAFVAQTKVFERADELKASLSGAIDTMKSDIAQLDAKKAEMAEIENQLGRIKRLEDEMSQKVARFLAEKRRIDALEADFARLSEVAQGVDRKLEEVTGASDALTEAQARIRKLMELSDEAATRYDRLEKKAAILDSTAEAVDKNFQTAQSVEKLLGAYGAELKRIPERIAELKKGIDELSAGKEKTEDAVRKLGELDGILEDAEKRIAEAQKAREWLARAETRLEDVNRQATEQLKLLSTLLKEEGGNAERAAVSRSAPPSTVQETVRKLARQGWKPEEIARTVKISRGEVELILELGGKN